jgi:hypothetical protein
MRLHFPIALRVSCCSLSSITICLPLVRRLSKSAHSEPAVASRNLDWDFAERNPSNFAEIGSFAARSTAFELLPFRCCLRRALFLFGARGLGTLSMDAFLGAALGCPSLEGPLAWVVPAVCTENPIHIDSVTELPIVSDDGRAVMLLACDSCIWPRALRRCRFCHIGLGASVSVAADRGGGRWSQPLGDFRRRAASVALPSGRRTELLNPLQTRYGRSKEEAEREIDLRAGQLRWR